jgi:hypothetical protein
MVFEVIAPLTVVSALTVDTHTSADIVGIRSEMTNITAMFMIIAFFIFFGPSYVARF